MIEERKERLCLELSLLQKPKWRWKDIATYFQCASAKANQIRKLALARGGKIDYDPHSVTCRSVMELHGTTPEIEIAKRTIELMGAAPKKDESNQ